MAPISNTVKLNRFTGHGAHLSTFHHNFFLYLFPPNQQSSMHAGAPPPPIAMALSSTKFVAINQLSRWIQQESSRSPLCISDSCSSVTSDGREHRQDLDEVGDPGDVVVLECAHGVLGAWRKAAPRPGAGLAASSASPRSSSAPRPPLLPGAGRPPERRRHAGPHPPVASPWPGTAGAGQAAVAPSPAPLLCSRENRSERRKTTCARASLPCPWARPVSGPSAPLTWQVEAYFREYVSSSESVFYFYFGLKYVF